MTSGTLLIATLGIWWDELKGAAEHLTGHGLTLEQSQQQNDEVQNVNNGQD